MSAVSQEAQKVLSFIEAKILVYIKLLLDFNSLKKKLFSRTV